MRVDSDKCEAAIWRRWYKQYRQCANEGNWPMWLVTDGYHPHGRQAFVCGTHRNVLRRNESINVVMDDDYQSGFRVESAVLWKEEGS